MESSKSVPEVEPFLSEQQPIISARKAENETPESCVKAENVPLELEKDDDNAHSDEEKKIGINLWKNCSFSISKTLIPLRVTAVLWFGAGKFIIICLGVFLRERGMTLAEISSVFSLIFTSHFLGSFMFGIIADKIGNAKPVLIFYMSTSVATVVCLLFAPNIGLEACSPRNIPFETSDFGNETNFEYCNGTCFGSSAGNYQISFLKDNVTSNDTAPQKFVLPIANSTLSFNTSVVDSYLGNGSCTISCRSNSQSGCSLTNRKVFLILYILLIHVLFAFWSNTYRVLDHTTLCLVNRTTSHFGKERCFGSIGDLVISSIIAFVMTAGTSGVSRYESVFWIIAVLLLLSVLSACQIKAVILPPGRKLTKKAVQLIKNPEVIAFITVVFVAGNAFSFNAVFNFWFLDNIKAPKLLILLHPVFSALYSIPALLTSRWWLKQFGTKKLLILGLLAYSVNMFSFSFLSNPWLSLIVEITVAFHFHMFWLSSVVDSHKLAPEGLRATLLGISGFLHFGIGRSSGVSLGGLLANYFGIRTAYRLMSALCLSTAVLYSIFLSRKYLRSRRNRESKKSGHDFEIIEAKESQPVRDTNIRENSGV